MSDRLPHDAVLAAFVVAAPGLLIVAAVVVLAAVLFHKPRAASVASAADAAGPGVPGLVAPGPDPLDLALDGPGTGDAALRELAFARDVECWAADRSWPAPVVVPGRSEP